mgnify:CR=1 FL=1
MCHDYSDYSDLCFCYGVLSLHAQVCTVYSVRNVVLETAVSGDLRQGDLATVFIQPDR